MRRLILTSFILQVSVCYYFTCDQIENELLSEQVQLPGTLACVIFEFPLNQVHLDYYDTVHLRDNGTGDEYSLKEIYTTCNYCVEGKGPWEVVNRGEDPITCHNEVVLLFSSQPTIVYPSNPAQRICEVPEYPLKTIVAPNSGAIQTQIIPLDESSVKVYLGVGRDESEQMYLIRESNSPFEMTMFNWVISVSENYKTLSVETRNPLVPFLGSSAILGNSHFKQIHIAKTFTEPYFTNPVIRLTGHIHYNSSNVLSILHNYEWIDLKNGSVDITMNGDFEISYLTHPDSYEFNRLNESFELYFEIIPSTDQPTDIPSQSTVTLTRIASPISSTATITPTVPSIVNPDTYCTCDVDENGLVKNWASQLWLDIVILVDTSISMGIAGVDEISSLIETLVGKMNLDSSGSSNLYSRVGLISLSSTANVSGIQLAMTMFQEGKKMSNYRESAREIIYLITNSVPQGTLNGAYEFKSSGGIIIVANYVREGQVPLEGLKSLASPYYFFTNLTDDYTYNLQVFCDANCFCPRGLHSFTDQSINPRQEANRGCFSLSTMGIPYKNAVRTCEKESGIITSIHDNDKQFFLNSIVSSIGPKTKYWIGYEYDGTTWNWNDQSSDPYSNWDTSNGQPDTKGGENECAYSVQTNGFNSEWYAVNCDSPLVFVCEMAPCAAGRYCTDD